MKNLAPGYSLYIGLVLGLMPVTKYFAAVLLVFLCLIGGFRKFNLRAVWAGVPVAVYCIIHLALLYVHPGMLIFDWELVRVYLVVLVVTLPICALLKSELISWKLLEYGIFFGIWISVIILGYDYIFLQICRATGFSSNPLIPQFVLIPLSFFLLSQRFVTDRASWMDYSVLFAVVISSGLFSGGRMALYSVGILCSLLVLVLLYYRKSIQSFLILLTLSIGIFVSILVDSSTGCGFSKRIFSQFKTLDALQTYSENRKIDEVDGESVEQNLTLDAAPQIAGVDGAQLDISSLQRWGMWGNAAAHIFSSARSDQVILGAGRSVERAIVNRGLGTNYSHSHNQFFSWIISGGLLGIASGLFLLWSTILRGCLRVSGIFVFSGIILGSLTNSPMHVAEACAQMLILILFLRCWPDGRNA